MRTDVVVDVHSGDDIDPSALVRAYSKSAKKNGAKIFENVRVNAIHQENGQVVGISTTKGDIKTNKVVNCGRTWARKLLTWRMCSVRCLRGVRARSAVNHPLSYVIT